MAKSKIKASTKKETTKGVLIIAIGPKYLDWAVNLIASIKFNSPALNICLAGDKVALDRIKPNADALISDLVEIPDSYYHDIGMRHCVKSKLFLDKLTPYNQTIYIDAENFVLPGRHIEELFGKFAVQNRGSIEVKNAPNNAEFIHWGNPVEIAERFDIKTGKFYNLFSELMVFDDSEKSLAIFEKAREAYIELFGNNVSFAGGVPDELCFMVALNQCKMAIDVNFMPTYWESAEKKQRLGNISLAKDYYLYSMGGNVLGNHMRNSYNRNDSIVRYYCREFGLTFIEAKNKRGLFTERFNI